MKIANDFILREIAGDYLVIPTGNTALSFNGLITLNEIGSFLWKQLEEDRTLEDLIEAILEEYDIDYDTAKVDIEDFLEYLQEKDLLTK